MKKSDNLFQKQIDRGKHFKEILKSYVEVQNRIKTL